MTQKLEYVWCDDLHTGRVCLNRVWMEPIPKQLGLEFGKRGGKMPGLVDKVVILHVGCGPVARSGVSTRGKMSISVAYSCS